MEWSEDQLHAFHSMAFHHLFTFYFPLQFIQLLNYKYILIIRLLNTFMMSANFEPPFFLKIKSLLYNLNVNDNLI